MHLSASLSLSDTFNNISKKNKVKYQNMNNNSAFYNNNNNTFDENERDSQNVSRYFKEQQVIN